MMKSMMSTVMPAEMCQFCFTNGESLEHCGSHRLKSPNGLVACPILRAFVCPQCGATGDHAHTVSYCPNRDGSSSVLQGASISELKKKKNAAGRYGRSRSKWIRPAAPVWTPTVSPHSMMYSKSSNYLPSSKAPDSMKSSNSPDSMISSKSPDSLKFSKSPDSLMFSKSPNSLMFSSYYPRLGQMMCEPDFIQLSLYRHSQCAQYYREKYLHHQAEISRLTAEKKKAPDTRSYKPPPGLAFTKTIWTHDGGELLSGYGEAVQRMGDIQLI